MHPAYSLRTQQQKLKEGGIVLTQIDGNGIPIVNDNNMNILEMEYRLSDLEEEKSFIFLTKTQIVITAVFNHEAEEEFKDSPVHFKIDYSQVSE